MASISSWPQCVKDSSHWAYLIPILYIYYLISLMGNATFQSSVGIETTSYRIYFSLHHYIHMFRILIYLLHIQSIHCHGECPARFNLILVQKWPKNSISSPHTGSERSMIEPYLQSYYYLAFSKSLGRSHNVELAYSCLDRDFNKDDRLFVTVSINCHVSYERCIKSSWCTVVLL